MSFVRLKSFLFVLCLIGFVEIKASVINAADTSGVYYIQLASFSNEANAIAYKRTLNLRAEEQAIISRSGKFYRVALGPFYGEAGLKTGQKIALGYVIQATGAPFPTDSKTGASYPPLSPIGASI